MRDGWRCLVNARGATFTASLCIVRWKLPGRLRRVPSSRAGMLDKVKAAAFLATGRVHVLRQAIMCCREAGTIHPGVYVGAGDNSPIGRGALTVGRVVIFCLR